MLMNCPRCGFQQPQDKYCAQCGVDMENYRPPQKSAGQKILGNPVFQVGVVLILAAAVGFSLYEKRQSDLDDRVSYLRNGTLIARSVSNRDTAETPTAPPNEAPPTTPAPEEAAATAALASSETAIDPNAATPAPTDAAAKSAPPTKAPLRPGSAIVRVFFAEISINALNQIFDESRATGQFNSLGDYVAGIVPDLGKKLTPSNREIKVLAREEKVIEPGRPVQFFQGLHQGDPENEIGLTYYVEMQDGDGTTFRGSLDVIRSWREGTPGAPTPTQKKTFPAVIELTRGSGFFMSGLLPSVSNLENEEELVAVPPFSIVRSSAFRSRATEAILFLEFDKP